MTCRTLRLSLYAQASLSSPQVDLHCKNTCRRALTIAWQLGDARNLKPRTNLQELMGISTIEI